MTPPSGRLGRQRPSFLALLQLLLLLLHPPPPTACSSLLYTDSKSLLMLEEPFPLPPPPTSPYSRPRRPNTTLILDRDIETGVALDYDYTERLLFWSDQGLETIRSLNLTDPANAHPIDVIRSDLSTTESIAVDWIAKKLYWTDTGLNRIEVANYNGSQRAVLVRRDLEHPNSIALVPSRGLLFWSDCGQSGKIERSSMDGAPASRAIIVEDRDNCLSGLTVDYSSQRIYFFTIPIKSGESSIQSTDYSGSNRENHSCSPLYAKLHPHPLFMTLSDQAIYWTDKRSKDIHSCSRHTSNPTLLQAHLKRRSRDHDDIIQPNGLKWFNASAQPRSSSPCTTGNGNCTHLCLLSSTQPTGHSCACPIGMKLQGDGRSCSENDKILLIARSGDIRKISLDVPDYTSVVLRKTNQSTQIDYDPVEEKIYWADEHEKVIRRAPLNASTPESSEIVISNEVFCLEAIAIDAVARNIYWTECDIVRIEVARLDGASRKILVWEDLEKPRAIVVHPEAGLMFWSDWGARPRIERANLDGSTRKTLISTRIQWPNGLALDVTGGRLFWGDAMEHTIEWAYLDGSQRTLLWRDKNIYIYGFTLLDGWIYFSDRQKRMIRAVDCRNGSNTKSIVDEMNNELPDWMGIQAVNLKAPRSLGPSSRNPCSLNNGNCSHFCFNRAEELSAVCACPAGYHLEPQNGKNCIFNAVNLLLLRKHDITSFWSENSTSTVIINSISSSKALDIDQTRGLVYWIDYKAKTISRAGLNSQPGSPELLHRLLPDSKPEDLALDWISNQLYWIDSAARRLELSTASGAYRKILVQFSENSGKPKSLVVDPVSGLLFLAFFTAGQYRIDRLFLDGTRIHPSNIYARAVYSLSVDTEERRLYWLDENRYIDSCRYDGSNRKLMKVQPGTSPADRPSGLALFGGSFYLLDSAQKSLRILDKKTLEPTAISGNNSTAENSGNYFKLPAETLEALPVHSLAQSGWNCCAMRTVGCSELCFYKPLKRGTAAYCDVEDRDSAVSCGCRVHYRLNREDNKTCLGPDSFLLYSHQQNKLTRFLFNSKASSSTNSYDFTETEHFTLAQTQNITALAYDSLEETLYWIDSGLVVKRKKLNDLVEQPVLQSADPTAGPDFTDLLVDPYSRILYWTSARTDSVNATRLIGQPTAVGTIFSGEAVAPRLLAMHYRNNYLFFTNAHPLHYGIHRTTLSTPTPTTTPLITSLPSPITALTIDQDLNFLIYTLTPSTIYYSDLSGHYQKPLDTEPNLHPISLATHSKYLFWLDRSTIEKTTLDFHQVRNKQTLYRRQVDLSSLISVVPMRRSLSSSKCAEENGGCSHLCLIVDTLEGHSDYACACPQSLVLSGDGKNCTEARACTSGEFGCSNGAQCVPGTARCNEIPDCLDGSDEINCSSAELEKTRVFQGAGGGTLAPPVPPLVTHKSRQHLGLWVIGVIAAFILIISLVLCWVRPYLVQHEKEVAQVTLGDRGLVCAQSGAIKLSELAPRSAYQPTAPPLPLSAYQIGGPAVGTAGGSATGSGSSGGVSHTGPVYPGDTGNPPPSPATVRSARSTYSSTANSRAPVYPLPPPNCSRKHSRKPRPKKKAGPGPSTAGMPPSGRTGPPPSLCGSENYDYLAPSTSVKYTLYENEHHPHLDYIPPAPTPRHYFSDAGSSCPPSPGTERSFCTIRNLNPPPPSPVPESDY